MSLFLHSGIKFPCFPKISTKDAQKYGCLCDQKMECLRFDAGLVQVYVSEELERDAPEVVDVRVPMSKYMVGIQKAIVEVMDACLKEMRKTNKVDVEDLTVENGLFKSFDEIVRRQLDPIWHTLGKKTRQLVSDLKTLRKLLDYLVR